MTNCDKKFRLLIIAPYAFPPYGAESLVTTKFISAALHQHWEIDVITASGIEKAYPLGNDKTVWQDVSNAVTIIPNRFIGKLGVIEWIVKSFFKGLVLAKKNNYDAIFSRATPIYGHLPAFFLKIFTNLPWIANWSDPLPSIKAPYPYGAGRNAKLNIFLKIYLALIVKFIDCHTFPSERLRNYFISYLPKIKEKSYVLPHLAIESESHTNLIAHDNFRLCFTGSLTLRPLDNLFQAFKRFTDSYPASKVNIHFVVEDINYVRSVAIKYGVDSIVTQEKTKSYQEVQNEVIASDVALVIEAICEEGVFFPSKFVDIVQLGIPILAISPRLGTLSDILNMKGGGVAADNNSIDSIYNAICLLYDAWEEGNLKRDFSSAHLMSVYGSKSVLAEFICAYKIATKFKK